MDRFQQREAQEVARVSRVLALVEEDGCQVNALVGYFGEQRAQPCGHCSYCLSGQRAVLPPRPAQPPLPAGLDTAELAALRAQYPHALAHPRQLARFLCGLSSPALAKAKLTRHPLFSRLESRRFHEVLAWCAS
jgi:ATP-dependent DNA helicase RecQ